MNFKRKIKKLFRKIKMNIENKKIIGTVLIVALCFSIIGIRFYNVQALPYQWDCYINVEGNSDIKEFELQKMKDYKDNFEIVPTDLEVKSNPHGRVQIGSTFDYKYTDMTVDKDKKQVSRWFLSAYGPFFDYISNNHKMNNSENESIKFTNDNAIWRTSNYVYVATKEANLADAKSAAMLHYTDYLNRPIIISNNAEKPTNNIIMALKQHSIKNMVVLGGSGRFENMFAIGEDLNTVRIGGAERNMTCKYIRLAEDAESKIYNVDTPPETDDKGMVCEIRGNANDMLRSYIPIIKSALEHYDFNTAAKIVLGSTQRSKDIHYGSESNIKSGEYSVLIGCRENANSKKQKFLKVYLLDNYKDTQYGVYQYIGKNYFEESEEPTEPSHDGPLAFVSAPKTVIAGDDCTINGTGLSKDPTVSSLTGSIQFENTTGIHGIDSDGKTKHYRDKEGEEPKPRTIYFSDKVWFDTEGKYKTYSIVKDNRGLTGISDKDTINVIAPVPNVVLTQTGTLKENRKITIDASKSDGGSERYKLDWSKARWEVSAVSNEGYNNTNNDIRIQTHTQGSTNGTILRDSSRGISKSLNEQKILDFTFKNAGVYKLKCTLTNIYRKGITASKEIYLNVEPDEPPVASFDAVRKVIRDIKDKDSNGLAQATIKCFENEKENKYSYSKDNDIIAKRIWLYAYDANNNDTWNDDKWYVYNNGSWQYLGSYSSAKNININNINDGNKESINIKTSKVGKYGVVLIVREEYGQEYIPQFNSSSDRKTDNTWDK